MARRADAVRNARTELRTIYNQVERLCLADPQAPLRGLARTALYAVLKDAIDVLPPSDSIRSKLRDGLDLADALPAEDATVSEILLVVSVVIARLDRVQPTTAQPNSAGRNKQQTEGAGTGGLGEAGPPPKYHDEEMFGLPAASALRRDRKSTTWVDKTAR